jgi:hypothetical protein
MNVEIGTETAQFPEKEYINRMFLAVYDEISSQKMQFNCGKIRQKSPAKNLPKPFWVRNPQICPKSVEQQEAIRRVVECSLLFQNAL